MTNVTDFRCVDLISYMYVFIVAINTYIRQKCNLKFMDSWKTHIYGQFKGMNMNRHYAIVLVSKGSSYLWNRAHACINIFNDCSCTKCSDFSSGTLYLPSFSICTFIFNFMFNYVSKSTSDVLNLRAQKRRVLCIQSPMQRL